MLKIKSQKNYYVTEVSFELPVDLNALDDLLKSTKSTARMISIVNDGGVLGVSVEQKTKITAEANPKVRELLGIELTTL